MPWLHDIDPVAFEIGPFSMRWYGLMYLSGYVVGLSLGWKRLRDGRLPVSAAAFLDLIFLAMLGIILGARLGHALFYAWPQTVSDPLSVLRIWEGGMSFHGGALGVVLAVAWWSKAHRIAFGDTIDFLVPLTAPGIAFGRLGNFINGELWGRRSNLPWAMIFPNSLEGHGGSAQAVRQLYEQGLLNAQARHPSQLYEMMLEGVVLFVVVWRYSRIPRPRWAVTGLFALLYGLFRIGLEFVRDLEPGAQALALGWITKGQVLSLPMVVLGAALLLLSQRRPGTVGVRHEP
ncbi:MAG: prolipoprotein diacylglyceryl transferase [Dokdonella sp.]|nr:prolipoprotein diacylglyceryl transferase [Dokdonella sp.]MCB1574483.1 prolipoprotein diacylglyceryl transferase [Xanthomonadales bacterium]